MFFVKYLNTLSPHTPATTEPTICPITTPIHIESRLPDIVNSITHTGICIMFLIRVHVRDFVPIVKDWNNADAVAPQLAKGKNTHAAKSTCVIGVRK